MGRNSLGRQRVWARSHSDQPLPFLWVWQSVPFYPQENSKRKLALLNRVWSGSRHYGAVFDALYVVDTAQVPCPRWVVDAAREAIAKPESVSTWKARYERDLLDVVRAMAFQEFRYDEEGNVLLSRDEAAEFATASLRGTKALTSKDALLRLLTRMQSNDRRAFGRYYLAAGSIHWETKHFPRVMTKEKFKLYRDWRHRAAVRGNKHAREMEEFDLAYIQKKAAQGSIQSLREYESMKRQDKSLR